MTDENITPEAEVADDMVADLAAEVAEDYSEADYAGGSDFVADADLAELYAAPGWITPWSEAG